MAARKTHTDVVNHHLVKAARAKRALDDICNGLGSKNYKKADELESVGDRIGKLIVGRWEEGCCAVHTVLVANVGT